MVFSWAITDRSSRCWKKGLNSTWLTAGCTVNWGTKVFQILGVMLLTPMAWSFPVVLASSMAFQAPGTSP